MVNVDSKTITPANHGELSDSRARSKQKKSPKHRSTFRRVCDALTPRIFLSKSKSESPTHSTPKKTKSANQRKPEISSPVVCKGPNCLVEFATAAQHQFSRSEPDGQTNLAGAKIIGDAQCEKSETNTNQLINLSEQKNESEQPQRYAATSTESTDETNRSEKDVCSAPIKPKRDPQYINTPLAKVETLEDPTSIPFADVQ